VPTDEIVLYSVHWKP